MLVRAYLDTAAQLVKAYTGTPPLAAYLSAFFKPHKQYGSRDRKAIADLVYGYFRLGPQPHLSTHEVLIMGAALRSRLPERFFAEAASEYVPILLLPLQEKIAWCQTEKNATFHVTSPLSNGLSEADFFEQLYAQPRVFIRIRRQAQEVIKQLKKAEISFIKHSDDCVSVPANTPLDKLLFERDYTIQDWASQATGQYWEVKANSYWWDCCAASGGKSLRLLDKGIPIHLDVSDVRETILLNLKQRLTQYGYGGRFRTHVLDVLNAAPLPGPFDAIIADVPCSGSGTWARSPEGFYFTDPSLLQSFHQKQVGIAVNAAQSLKPGGTMYYITCSVFALENEDAVKAIVEKTGLRLREQHVIRATEIGSDALYTAILEK
jgi:16S rRNA (cytosine967-C5)-methyltransferase